MTNPVTEFLREAGRKGGKAAAERLTPEQLSKRGRKAVQARWKKTKKGKTAK